MATMASADTDAQSIKALERFAANLGQVKYNAYACAILQFFCVI